MVGFRTVMILTVLMTLILAVVGHKDGHLHARHAGNFGGEEKPCTNYPELNPSLPPCSTTTKSSTTTTTTTNDPTALERAHWCRFPNNTYLPLDYSFMNTVCSLCQCTRARTIRCQALQCMPTYCIDNKMPLRKSGQCCTQCDYEPVSNACVYKNISFPHGTVIKAIENKMQCWCQLGNIECRNYMGSVFQTLDVLTDGAAVYIIMIVLIVVLIFGLLLCCGCTIIFYYYYQRNQHSIQQAYDQYVNSAGWQPMNDGEENVVDASAEEKRIEAEKQQYENSVGDVVPPPYAGYNNSYVSEQEQKQI